MRFCLKRRKRKTSTYISFLTYTNLARFACKFFNSFLTNLLLIEIQDNLAVNKKAKPFS